MQMLRTVVVHQMRSTAVLLSRSDIMHAACCERREQIILLNIDSLVLSHLRTFAGTTSIDLAAPLITVKGEIKAAGGPDCALDSKPSWCVSSAVCGSNPQASCTALYIVPSAQCRPHQSNNHAFMDYPHTGLY
jgi:hypothetical protein